MHSTLDPALGHDFDEPARPTWAFRKRIAAQAEPTEPDDPSDTKPTAFGPAVTPKLRELCEAHFWPHARKAGDLSSPARRRS